MSGNKTHEHQQRQLQEGLESQDWRSEAPPPSAKHESGTIEGVVGQESRGHNKHNNPGQVGHKPQRHSPAEEKQT